MPAFRSFDAFTSPDESNFLRSIGFGAFLPPFLFLYINKLQQYLSNLIEIFLSKTSNNEKNKKLTKWKNKTYSLVLFTSKTR